MVFHIPSATKQDRVQLSQETDTIRHTGLQTDIELKELQSGLDKGISKTSFFRN
jgi:hypothetical protein